MPLPPPFTKPPPSLPAVVNKAAAKLLPPVLETRGVVSSPKATTPRQLASLEDGMRAILNAMATMQRDIAEIRLKQQQQQCQQVPGTHQMQQQHEHENEQHDARNAGKGSRTISEAVADADVSTQQSVAAQERLQRVIEGTHAQFLRFDHDHSGNLDVKELAVALNSLGKLQRDQQITAKDARDLLDGYDNDRNGRLSSEEFSALLIDVALSGRFEFRPDLQQDLEVITRLVKDDPWVSVKQDRDVRNMIDALREAALGSGGQRRGLRRLSTRMLTNRPSVAKRSSTTGRPEDAGQEEESVHATSAHGRLCRLCCFCFCCLPIINPDGRLRTCWNLATALLIIYCGVSVPLEIAFESTMQDGMGVAGWQMWEGWNLFVDACFLCDIVLNFRTSFLHEGHMVRDQALIASHYLRGASSSTS